MFRSDLARRVASAVVAIPVVVLLLWLGVNATAALIAAAAAIATLEFHGLGPQPPARWRSARPMLLLGLAGAVLFAVDAAMESSFTLPLIAGAVIVPILAQVLIREGERDPAEWAWTVAGLLYIGWVLSLAVLLRNEEQGREWVITVLVLTFAVDTGAYLFGRLAGRRKLAPSISPGKTWEGAGAGVLVGAGAGAASAAGFDLDIELWQAVLMGLLVGVFGQLGDLAESMLKRSAGAKDSGGLIPGHGGLLDRLDSLIPAIAVIYFTVHFLGR